MERAAPPLGGRLFVFVVFGELWVFYWGVLSVIFNFGEFGVEVGVFWRVWSFKNR